MSGLVGLFGFPADRLQPIVAQIADELCRFPWNTWDWWLSPDGTMGLGRVDIGVFNPLPQPATSPDGQVLALLSGELYRTVALRRDLEARGCQFQRQDDPELVLLAYLSYGPEFVSRLEGAFHLAILDRQKGELLIANDRYGLRPLYWIRYGDRFAFAPEVKALLADPAVERRLDLVSVAQYMRFQQLLGDRTFFEGISLLAGASLLRYDLKGRSLSIAPYWSLDEIPTLDSITYGEYARESGRLYREAMGVLAAGPQRVGAYLSGGVDSRIIAACLAQDRPHFPTISYGHRNSADVILAKRIATLLGTDHHYCEFNDGRWVLDHLDLHLELTEGHHSWIHSHGISTLKDARSHLDVNVTGWGTGNILGNSWRSPLLNNAVDEWAFLCRFYEFYTQQHTWPGLTEAEERALYAPQVSGQMVGLAFESFQAEVARMANHPFVKRVDYFCVAHHLRRLTQNFVIFNSSHFENRFPAHDYRLFEFLFSYPQVWQFDKQLQQDIVEQINPRLALIPLAQDHLLHTRRRGRRMAHHVVTRVKQRVNRHLAPVFWFPQSLYADYENWLRHELRDWATELLLDGRLADRGIFRPEFVASLLNRHFSGQELHTIGKIAPLMTFEMMMRRFFD